MKSIGPILTNYNDLTMKFLQRGKMIELKGDHEGCIHIITGQQVQCLIHTNGASFFFHV